jgi:putative addiction module killer protein
MRDVHPREIRIYQTLNGREPFAEWLESIQDRRTQRKIRARLEQLKFGNFGDHRLISEGVFELRFHFRSGYRIYLGRVSTTAVLLLCGGDKSSQTRDIEGAKRYWLQYKKENL